MDALDALEVVTAELNRLAALARSSDDYRAALAIAREPERHGASGSRRATWACPLARHLSRRSGARVGGTRHEVVLADRAGAEVAYRIPFNPPGGALGAISGFVVQFDDHRRRFRWLEDNRA